MAKALTKMSPLQGKPSDLVFSGLNIEEIRKHAATSSLTEPSVTIQSWSSGTFWNEIVLLESRAFRAVFREIKRVFDHTTIEAVGLILSG